MADSDITSISSHYDFNALGSAYPRTRRRAKTGNADSVVDDDLTSTFGSLSMRSVAEDDDLGIYEEAPEEVRAVDEINEIGNLGEMAEIGEIGDEDIGDDGQSAVQLPEFACRYLTLLIPDIVESTPLPVWSSVSRARSGSATRAEIPLART